MSTWTHDGQLPTEPRTLTLIANTVGVLAFVTGILYARVFVSDGMLTTIDGQTNWRAVHALLLLVITLAALFLAWRELPYAAYVAIAGGVALGIVMAAVADNMAWLSAFFYGSPFVIAGLLFAVDQAREAPSAEPQH